MKKLINKVFGLSFDKSFDDIVSLGSSASSGSWSGSVSDGDYSIMPDDGIIYAPVDDVSKGDSSGDDDSDENMIDVSGSDVSGSDISGSDVLTVPMSDGAYVCTCKEPVLLWESDINEYDTTDGLLLLILIFTIINTAWNVIGRR